MILNAWLSIPQTMNDLGEWLRDAHARLSGVTEFPFLESSAIAASVLNKPREWIISKTETPLSPECILELNTCIDRLINGEPLAYITGKAHFYGLEFSVNRNVLIPRPETELMIEEAIAWLKARPGRRSVADIGTGSGAISIALAKSFSDIKMTATDISQEALNVAELNSRSHQVENRINFLKNDLLMNIQDRFDLLLANLPYIPSETLDTLPVSKFEPRLALDGAKDGLRVIRKLLEQSTGVMLPGGCIFLEIQYNQAIAVMKTASMCFASAEISLIRDLASLPRLVKIQL